MKSLIDKEKKFIGERIKDCRKLLSLSQEQLAKATDISKGTLAKMEAGLGFTGDYLLNVCYFFGMSLSDFTNPHMPLPNEGTFREILQGYYKKHKPDLVRYLKAQPTLNSLIEFRLKDSFLIEPRTVGEIVNYCKEEYNLSFKSSVVSQALINGMKAGWLKRTKLSAKAFSYQVKQKTK